MTPEVQLGARTLRAGGPGPLAMLKFRPVMEWSQGTRIFRTGPQPMLMGSRTQLLGWEL